MGGFRFVAVILLAGLPSIWAPGPRNTKKGNDAFRKGLYDKALEHYYKAMQVLPGDRALSYNAGTTLLKQEKHDEALRSLMAGSQDPRQEIRTPSLYNSGNALYAAQKYPEAVSAYREAVLSNSRDMDAKFNYELAQYRLKKQQQENEKNKDQNQDDKNQDQKDKKDQSQNQNQDQKENEEQKDSEEQKQQPEDEQKPNQGQEQKPNQDQEEQPQDAKPEGGEPPRPASLLSKQEAERLLDALKANEMEMIKARLKSNRKKNVDRDW